MGSIARIAIAAAFTVCALAASARAQTNLILTTMSQPGNDFSTKFFGPWAARINQASHGTLHIDPRDGFAIANFTNVYDRVMNDAVQIGWGMQGLVAGKFPLTEVATFPFEAQTAEQGSEALWKLYATGMLDQEYRDIKPLVLGIYPINGVHYAKMPKSFDDFSGLKLRTASKIQSDWIEALRGAPISMGMEDLYQALQRGEIDATLQAWTTYASAPALAEVTNVFLDVKLGTSTVMIFMTKQKYDALPPEARAAIDQNSGEAMSRAWGKFVDETAAAAGKKVLAMPGQIVEHLTDAQTASWEKHIQPVTDAWIASHPNGAALSAKYQAFLADFKPDK